MPPKIDRTVKACIRTYLRRKGYVGLCCYECGCDIDDLMPCDGSSIPNCRPAREKKWDEKSGCYIYYH